jgi:hypothetical protein
MTEIVKKKNIEFKEHIGIYDGYIPEVECDKAIAYYEKQNSLNKAYDRIQSENASINTKSDKAINLGGDEVETWFEEFKPLLVNFDLALRNYQISNGLLSAYGVDKFKYTTLKIQKTLPGQGYHIWHLEHGHEPPEATRRVLAFTIYLNDIKEGGETEFLHQSVRAKPVKGRCVIWPAGFPYLHRGNPPLQGEKYIITSWLLLPSD